MDIAKKIGLVILSPIFVFLLFATAFDVGFIHTATHPATVKKLVADSGIYQNIIPAALDQAQQKSDGGNQGVSLADPAVKAAAEQAFSPQFLQNSTNNIIDGVYHWLDGTASQPDFKVDLSTQKAVFADLVAQHAGQVAAGLPKCTPADSQALLSQGADFDVFSAQCLPQGIAADSAAAQVKQQLLNNQDFLKNAVITADSLKTNDSTCPTSSSRGCSQKPASEPFFQTDGAKQVPKQYQRAKKTPFIFVILTILCGAGIVFLSKTRQKGLRHVGINLAVIGLIMLIFAWALNAVAVKKLVPKIKIDNAVIQTDVHKLATDLIQLIDKNYWFFGGLYTVVGAGAIGGAEFYRRKTISAPATDSTEAPAKTTAVKKK